MGCERVQSKSRNCYIHLTTIGRSDNKCTGLQHTTVEYNGSRNGTCSASNPCSAMRNAAHIAALLVTCSRNTVKQVCMPLLCKPLHPVPRFVVKAPEVQTKVHCAFPRKQRVGPVFTT
eukprot:5928885-Amphidinium_carterae.1